MKTVVVAALFGAAGASATLMLILPRPASPTAAGLAIRIVAGERDSPGCDAGEDLLGAYCYSTPGRSLSASGVGLRQEASGRISATCLTGGGAIRLVCMKPAP
jgi:hypothetical protein